MGTDRPVPFARRPRPQTHPHLLGPGSVASLCPSQACPFPGLQGSGGTAGGRPLALCTPRLLFSKGPGADMPEAPRGHPSTDSGCRAPDIAASLVPVATTPSASFRTAAARWDDVAGPGLVAGVRMAPWAPAPLGKAGALGAQPKADGTGVSFPDRGADRWMWALPGLRWPRRREHRPRLWKPCSPQLAARPGAQLPAPEDTCGQRVRGRTFKAGAPRQLRIGQPPCLSFPLFPGTVTPGSRGCRLSCCPAGPGWGHGCSAFLSRACLWPSISQGAGVSGSGLSALVRGVPTIPTSVPGTPSGAPPALPASALSPQRVPGSVGGTGPALPAACDQREGPGGRLTWPGALADPGSGGGGSPPERGRLLPVGGPGCQLTAAPRVKLKHKSSKMVDSAAGGHRPGTMGPQEGPSPEGQMSHPSWRPGGSDARWGPGRGLRGVLWATE